MSAAAFKGRREDQRLLTGRGRYTADADLPDPVHACFLRPDHAHAEIVGIDAEQARRMPGVVGIFTGADVVEAGFETPVPLMPTGKDGTSLYVPPRPAIAVDRVRFVGEIVAMVVAETANAASDAAEAISVEFQELPFAIGAAAAARPGAPQLHPQANGNLAIETEYGDAESTDGAFRNAAHVAHVELVAQRIAAHPMEPKSCLVAHDPEADAWDFYIPTQGMSHIRHDLSHALGIESGRIRVHAHDVGGAFGVRNEAYPEYMAAFLAAKAIGRPVKWTGTRYETTVSDHHGRAATLTGELALDTDGRFLAMRVGWAVDLGAYCTNAGPFINTMAAPRTMTVNAYRIETLYGRHRLFFSNATPTTAYRGAGRPNVAFLVERLVDEAARISGIDRFELRRRNLIPPSAFPYRTPTGSEYDSADPPALLDAAMAEADADGFAARREEAKSRGRLRGLGVGLFIEPSGAPAEEEIAIHFDGSGQVRLYAVNGPSGQGHETVFPEVVARVFGIDPEQITLHSSDPQGPELSGIGTFGSRSLLCHGNALAHGAHEVIRKGAEHAARTLEVAAEDVTFEAGRYRVDGTDLSIGFSELVVRLGGSEPHPLDTKAAASTPQAFPSGAHIAEVEIDPETGVVTLVNYVAIDDCGEVISPVLVEGQILGGVMQGIGQVLCESILYDDAGQLLTGSFMDYTMPRADDWPSVALRFRGVASPTNALGVKGAGEAGATGSVPAITNAMFDALGEHLDTPYTPARVWQALAAAARRGNARHAPRATGGEPIMGKAGGDG